jgi:hypothetical protein
MSLSVILLLSSEAWALWARGGILPLAGSGGTANLHLLWKAYVGLYAF